MMFAKNGILLTVLAVLVGMAFTAQAADIFNRHPSSQPKTQEPVKPSNEEVLELLDEAPRVQEAEPEPESIEDFANRYYKNCNKQQHPYLNKDDLKLLCGCTSAKIPESMTVKQMRDMQAGGSEGQLQRARMMLFVYTPCIRYPTRSLVMDRCLNNPQVRGSMKNYRKVCGCLADNMADYMDKEAPKAMETALTRNMTDLDPLGALMNSRGFEEYSEFYMKECISKHELGISK